MRAYDAAGATATFKLNLQRINRELGGDFDMRASSIGPSTMREGRIDMHLVSLQDQSVRIRGRRITSAPARGSTPKTPTSTRSTSSGI